jgi:hypothetical protein
MKLALLLFAATLLAAAPPARAENTGLDKPYQYKVGDAIAARMQGIFRVVAGLEASVLVYYDRDTKLIVAEIVGGTDDLEGAKREIGFFVEAIRAGVVPYAKKRHGIALTDTDITLIYYNAPDEDVPVEIVRRENGAFVVPKEDQGGEDDREP